MEMGIERSGEGEGRRKMVRGRRGTQKLKVREGPRTGG